MPFRAIRTSDTRYTLMADGAEVGFAKLMPGVGKAPAEWWAHVELPGTSSLNRPVVMIHDATGRTVREALMWLRRHIDARVGYEQPIRHAA